MASLSRHLQSPEILQNIGTMSPPQLRAALMERGNAWYTENPAESDLIRENLASLELKHDDATVAGVKEHIILHYYEKLLPLCGDAAWYHNLITTQVDTADAFAQLTDAAKNGGILIAVAHFGAVELVTPTIATLKKPVNAVLRFTTEKFSELAKGRAQSMEASGLFGKINFIEIGREGTMAALDMAAAIRRGEILFSVFDEETGYSIPAPLFGKQVMGGAGLQNLIKFARAPLTVFCAFMVRTGIDAWRLRLVKIENQEKPVDAMYAALESVLADNLEQWYFLHEEIPFVK